MKEKREKKNNTLLVIFEVTYSINIAEVTVKKLTKEHNYNCTIIKLHYTYFSVHCV